MKTIGLIGGLTWFSTIDYYRYINQEVNRRLGGDEAARIIVNSVNYGEIKKLTQAGDWRAIAGIICKAARETETAGADCLLIGANTMHHIADKVTSAVSIPVIHVADAVAKAIVNQDIGTIALLGTRYTMQFDFYRNRLATYGIKTLIPDDEGVEFINASIYEELGKGLLLPETRHRYQDIIGELMTRGAQGVILGCTEIPLLIKPEHSPVPVFDTTMLHANAAVDFALG